MNVPSGPMSTVELIPILQGFVQVATDIAQRDVETRGEAIACRTGCGACCRQPVPISESEARYLAAVVAALPEESRRAVEQRFADAVERLSEGGLLEQLPHANDADERQAFGLEYLARGVACPFLVEESCGIHQHRPLSCREHLVTTPPELCAEHPPDKAKLVPLPAKFSRALYTFDDGRGDDEPRWVPLVLALDWAKRHAHETPPTQPGPALLEAVLRHAAK